MPIRVCCHFISGESYAHLHLQSTNNNYFLSVVKHRFTKSGITYDILMNSLRFYFDNLICFEQMEALEAKRKFRFTLSWVEIEV